MAALRGVNLGGWLVLEKWITPSIFAQTDATNEYQLSQHAAGRKKIAHHHKTFITEADFEWLAQNGIELIRIPFGHWVFGDTRPYVGAIDHLDWAVAMAKKYKIQVLLDMHAAVGAQNQADHSGSGRPHAAEAWLRNRTQQRETIAVIEKVVTRYHHESHIWGIQLLNEPGFDRLGFRLIRFYRAAYRAVQRVARPGTRVVFSDAYAPWLLTGALWSRANYPVVMDSHFYYCFGPLKTAPFAVQKRRIETARRMIRALNWFQPVMIGEWSASLDISVDKATRAEFIWLQLQSQQHAVATCYWNYKTEQDSWWSYRYVVQEKLLPSPAD